MTGVALNTFPNALLIASLFPAIINDFSDVFKKLDYMLPKMELRFPVLH